ncbi:hypothetical protein CONCODRAFT_3117 [Conidiobolus coronatus NRRL 28638]|uniref:Amine oxidase domain-containing protein n=1 Tax=Conidiobolus coronatus (strain ATCC 28846 / CBS 209.66 / NRRL 28638) TaxID=796925 RepID=A0A137PFV5_CONC2|nr:hypothetical protein CONCODRAFT_3117 [Conidiobolus coronatus NRRL 28638]|eukprot:KXN73878.1 hypothetical protein CONCODRAFT_3117 [Conidiobolus coronatus NRRL 28638]
MKLINLALLTLSALALDLSFLDTIEPSEVKELIDYLLPVCVVGTGLSGLTIADRLTQKGYNVKLFEKEDRVGGKVNTFRKDSQVYNMGAAILSEYHLKTFELLNSAGINYTQIDKSYSGGFDVNSGVHSKFDYYSKDRGTIGLIERYSEIRKRLNVDPGYLNASPELFETTTNWLKTNELEGLVKFASHFLTTQGYGNVNTTPALYFIQLMDIIGDVAKPLYHIPSGIDQLTNYMAKDKNVILNANITKIKRNGYFSTIKYTTNNRNRSQLCSNIVLAFPPHTKDVKNLVPDLSEEEKITNLPYTGFYFSALLPPQNPPYMGDGIPMVFYNQTNEAFVSYHWIEGEYDTRPTDEESKMFENRVKSLFQKINPGPGSELALHAKSWTYFPHVTVESLKNGFYKKFDEIQGKKGLYYATPLLGFEIMESTITSAEYLAEKFF